MTALAGVRVLELAAGVAGEGLVDAVVDDLAVRAQPLPVARAGADGSRRGV